MGCGLSDHHAVLHKVRLVGAWITRREVVVGARRIRSKKLREHKYGEGYPRSLKEKGVEIGKNPKSVWWNDEKKLQLGERRLLGRGCWQQAMKSQKKDVWKYTEKRKVKRCIIQSKKKEDE